MTNSTHLYGQLFDFLRQYSRTVDFVSLKQDTWVPQKAESDPQEYVLMNYLFQGDQGYTMPDLFEALQEAELELICMVNQAHWDLNSVFQTPQMLPAFWQTVMPQLTMEDRLQIFELIAPVHRLLDFWCGYAGQTPSWQPPQSWQASDWQKAQIQIHPQLQTDSVKADLLECIQQQRSISLISANLS